MFVFVTRADVCSDIFGLKKTPPTETAINLTSTNNLPPGTKATSVVHIMPTINKLPQLVTSVLHVLLIMCLYTIIIVI